MGVWKWLRQHSKEFYAAGVNAMVKQLEKCIDVDREYLEK
jgi:hypothetical protein